MKQSLASFQICFLVKGLENGFSKMAGYRCLGLFLHKQELRGKGVWLYFELSDWLRVQKSGTAS